MFKIKNWKTTGIGIASAIGYLIVRSHTPEGVTADDITLAIGVAGIGLAAKDHNKTGK